MRKQVPPIDIEEVCKGLGVEYVKTVYPFESIAGLVGEVREMVKWARENHKPAVLISREPCALLKAADRRRAGETPPKYYVDQEENRKIPEAGGAHASVVLIDYLVQQCI